VVSGQRQAVSPSAQADCSSLFTLYSGTGKNSTRLRGRNNGVSAQVEDANPGSLSSGLY
jgi:hypothetical protein